MKGSLIILPALVSTSLMTGFSCLSAVVIKKNFSEPELLAEILEAYLPRRYQKHAKPAGWLCHYSLGTGWYVIYLLMSKRFNSQQRKDFPLRFGLAGGILGIACWRYLFRKSNNKDKINFYSFYVQLFLAHLVFSYAASKQTTPAGTVAAI